MQTELNHFKDKLEAEKASLEADLNKVGEKNQTTGEWQVKPTGEADPEFRDDVNDQLEEMDEREEVETSLEERYKEVVAALKRIDDGNYGMCEVDGGAIEADRLEANPAARTCKAHVS